MHSNDIGKQKKQNNCIFLCKNVAKKIKVDHDRHNTTNKNYIRYWVANKNQYLMKYSCVAMQGMLNNKEDPCPWRGHGLYCEL